MTRTGRLPPRSPFARVAPRLSLAGLAAIAVLLCIVEVTALRQADRPGAPQVAMLPLSTTGREALLHACGRALSGITADLAPAHRRAQDAASCLDLAERLAPRMPVSAHRALVEASARDRLGDATGAADALHRAFALAPREGWMAERRVRAILGQDGLLPDDFADLVARDIATLMDSRAHAPALAQIWLLHPPLRPTITAVAETADTPARRRLVRALRNAAALDG